MIYKVKAASHQEPGCQLIVEGNVDKSTDTEYDKDANTLFEFSKKLPSGTIDRFLKLLKEARYID